MPIERSGRDVRIIPAGPVEAVLRPPGSKSLTNRLLACAALADGVSTLREVSLADDARAMLAGLDTLGVHTRLDAARREISIQGTRGNLTADGVVLDVGNAGTAMRFLTALACIGYGRRTVDGSARMRQRPIGELVDGLRALGAAIGHTDQEGFPPLSILAGSLTGGDVQFSAPPSSQFVSALLMVAPYATRDVYIDVAGALTSRPYVDMTIAVMAELGVEVVGDGQQRFVVPALQRYRSGVYSVEPDASAATYWWAAAAITGGRVRIEGLSRASRQGDVRFVDVLGAMGCTVRDGPDWLEVAAPANQRLTGITVDLNEMPDTAQTLAVVALFATGPTEIRDVPNLRIKETDRIAALAAELARLGAEVEAHEDGLRITPPTTVQPGVVRTYDDHRMAMSFAVAGLAAEGIVIQEAGVVAKSYPEFFDVLTALHCP